LFCSSIEHHLRSGNQAPVLATDVRRKIVHPI
jgi:hypothetical protein